MKREITTQSRIRELVYAALFAGIVAVLGLIPPIPLPLGVPITLQTFGVMLAGGLLGKRVGSISMLLFILLVAIGLPVLSGGRGGVGFLFGPTGGYIFSWPLVAYLIGFVSELRPGGLHLAGLFAVNIVFGIMLVYICGIAYLMLITEVSFKALVVGHLIFLPGDLLKALLAAWLFIRIQATYPPIKRLTK